MPNKSIPQIMLAMTPVERLKIKKGTIKVNAKTNLKKKVEKVDSQTSLSVCLFSDSSEIWIPRESEKASATAIINIPPITANVEWVLEFNPTINPKVVMTAEVIPKLKPTFIECFIEL